MTNLLLKIFVKNYKDVGNAAVRDRVGNLSSGVGIFLNLLLSAAKITVGALFGLVSVFADGINNLTDCGSNVVSLVSIRLASRPADKEHPYGHRRAEYVASMIVAFLVLVASVELASEGVSKIISVFNGSADELSWEIWTIVTLSVSVLIKLWMFFFNGILGKRYSFGLLKATAVDSISDVCSTAAVLIALIVSHYTGFNADGFMAVIVSVVIAVSGIKILKETFKHLLGEGADESLARFVKERIIKFDGVLGVHDLNIHNYGPNSYYANVHVEVDARVPILDSHDIIDQIERDFAENTNIKLVIHMDPIVIGDPELDGYKEEITEIVKSLDDSFDIHDFRMVKGPTHINLIFDVAISFDTKLKEREIADYIQAKVNEKYSDVYIVATVEKQIK